MDMDATTDETSVPGPDTVRPDMPFMVGLILVYHALVTLALTVAFVLLLFLPAVRPIGLLLLAGLIAVYALILRGTWLRRPGAWFGVGALQCLAVLTNFISLMSLPSSQLPGEAVVRGIFLLLAVVIVAYLFTPEAHHWFHVQRSPRAVPSRR